MNWSQLFIFLWSILYPVGESGLWMEGTMGLHLQLGVLLGRQWLLHINSNGSLVLLECPGALVLYFPIHVLNGDNLLAAFINGAHIGIPM